MPQLHLAFEQYPFYSYGKCANFHTNVVPTVPFSVSADAVPYL